MSIQTQLRDALSAEAERVDSAEAHPYERVSAAVGRSRRTRRATGAGALALAAALAIGVPAATQHFGDRTSDSVPAGQVKLPPPGDPVWKSLETWPTRGKLAGDKALVAAVGKQLDGHPIFVEDVGDTRAAVVASHADVVIGMAARGAPASDLTRVSNTSISTYPEKVLAVSADRRLIVLTEPGRRAIPVSVTDRVDLDGRTARQWTDVVLADGVARTEWTPLTVLRVGSEEIGVQHAADSRGSGDNPAGRCTTSCTPDQTRAATEAEVDRNVALLYAVDAGQVSTRTISLLDDVPTAAVKSLMEGVPPEAKYRLQVLESTLPEGQLLRSAILAFSAPDNEGGATGGSVEIELGRPVPARAPGSVPLILYDAAQGREATAVWVAAPRGGARVQLVSKDPSLWPSSAMTPFRNGAASLTLPVDVIYFQSQYEVRILDSGGRTLHSAPVMGPEAWGTPMQP